MINEQVIEKILLQPEFIGFEYRAIIGNGGFATVAKVYIETDKTAFFKDYERSLEDNEYALKVIDTYEGYKMVRPVWNGSFEEYKRMKVNQEYENIKRISASSQNFQHIVPIIRHQQIVLEGKHYLCILMPYYACSALANQGRFEEEAATIDFALQISQGLKVMHDHHLIHRDLKLDNILEEKKDFKSIYKITDLGVVRIMEEGKKTGNTSIVVTSDYYTAPECINHEYSNLSDIYSLGMCIARFRFHGKEKEFYHMVTRYPVNRIPWPDYYSKELVEIIQKCIQKNPENRYQSVEAIIEDVSHLQQEKEKAKNNKTKELEYYQSEVSKYEKLLREANEKLQEKELQIASCEHNEVLYRRKIKSLKDTLAELTKENETSVLKNGNLIFVPEKKKKNEYKGQLGRVCSMGLWLTIGLFLLCSLGM